VLKTASQIADEVLWKLAFQGRMGFESSRAGIQSAAKGVARDLAAPVRASNPGSFVNTLATKVPPPPAPKPPKPPEAPKPPPPPKTQVAAKPAEVKQPETKPLPLSRMRT
jgi:outer membrane biosynthesis protein TonB